MKILMAASELLSETERSACLALSRELHKLSHKVSIVLPFYRSLLKEKKIYPKSTGVQFSVPIGTQYLPCEIFETHTIDGIQLLFIGRDEFFDREEPGSERHYNHSDKSACFAFYARCVIQLARRISPLPDIIQCYDWQTALIPAMVKDAGLPFKTVLSISSLEDQGNFWSRDFAFTNLPKHYFSATGLEFYGSLNFLKGGILFADAIVLPSSRYMIEAQKPEYGCGLDAVLREHSQKLHEICDGISCDKSIDKFYGVSHPAGKSKCSSELLSSLHLTSSPKGPVITVISRLLTSEGVAMLLAILDRLLAEDVRIVVFGRSGGSDVALRVFAHRYRFKFAYLPESDESTLHQIFTGADIFLSPSDLELDGATLMKSLKYGIVPVIRACSGFYQFVQDYEPANKSGTGFVFYENTPEAFLDGIRRALEIFQSKDQWTQLVSSILSQDFSWRLSAKSFESVYTNLVGAF
ncbi:MAG: hypothetical protein C5B47_08350 [Verrucomicrobia bacterium]|nr:MAG: hypothetical protein C5B47_08350 [Verrucomicrobiota bacterium]